jgi:CreA protein
VPGLLKIRDIAQISYLGPTPLKNTDCAATCTPAGDLMKTLFVACALALLTPSTYAENIGSVSTKFKLIGPNDKIAVEVFDDPQIAGAACYLSRARTGGVSGAIGIAEDTSDASIACRQVGPINLPENVRNAGLDGHEVFKQRTSLVFKSLQVVRFYDAKRNVLVYLSYSDRIIEGSPKNSISVVPIMPWPQGSPSGADRMGVK